MQLDKQQKEDLKSLTEHRGFKILELIAEEKRQDLFTQFETLPLGDKEIIQRISGAQNYSKGMRDLLALAKNKTKEVAEGPDMT